MWLIDVTRELDLAAFHTWFLENEIQTLNVAGPRESTSPGIGEAARQILRCLLASVVQFEQPAKNKSQASG